MRVQQVSELKILRNESEDYRKFIYNDRDWDRFGEYWRGKQDIDEDVLPIPALASNGYTQLGALLQDVRVEITAVNDPALIPGARIATQIINQMNDDTHLVEEILDACQDAITYGTGGLLDGFGSQYGVQAETNFTGTEMSRYDKDQDKRLEFHDYVFEDSPFTIRVHPKYFLFPPGTVDPQSAFGFFMGYVRHIDDVKADEKYISKHRNAVQPNASVKLGHTRESSQDHKHVFLWDWYDLRTNKRTTFSEDYPFALADETDEMLVRFDRLPLHTVVFNKQTQDVWGASDFGLLEPLNRELNHARTTQMIYRNLSVLKGFINVDALAEGDELEKVQKAIKTMTTDEVLALIEVHGNPDEVVKFITPHQPYDLAPQIEQTKKEMAEYGTVAIGPAQKGQMSGGRHTKYEVQATEGRFEQTLYPRRRVLVNIIQNVVRNRLKLIHDFWQEPKVARTYNAAGQPVLVEFKGKDLRGDFRINVKLQSMSTMTRDDRMQEAERVVNVSMPFVQLGVCDPNALYRQYLLNTGSDRWDIDSLTIQPEQPLGQPIPYQVFSESFQATIPQNPNAMQAALSMQGQPQMPMGPPGGGQGMGIPSPPKMGGQQ